MPKIPDPTRPFDRVMLAVGGIRAMARLHRTRPSTVSGWRKRGCIPGDRLDLLNEERRAGRLRRVLSDGTLLDITADDLIKAARSPDKAPAETSTGIDAS